ncbi:M28 family peptidase [Pseudoalteromonas mariniglutinosa]|uniref:M28 family peptidase n=1 Tax=Pseudoalteromonas mariniglutinosa TaxID=206042 RepID=UPI0038510B36
MLQRINPTALTLLLTICPFDALANTLEQDITSLTATEFMGRKSGTPGALLAGDYITQRFTQLGYIVQEQVFSYSTGLFSTSKGRNIIASQQELCHQCRQVIITAHYDHLGKKGFKLFPGANDNASGVAALLYLAEYFFDHALPYQLLFVATDAEENGLYGSQYLVSQLNPTHVKMNINLDMLAVKPDHAKLYAFLDKSIKKQYQHNLEKLSDERLTVKVTTSSLQLNRRFNTKIDWRKASDHYSFAKADIAFIYFAMGDDKHHHKSTDHIDNIDQGLYRHTVQKITDFIDSLGSMPTQHK